MRVYLPRAQRSRVIARRAFARTDAVHARRIFPEELAARRHDLVMTFRASMHAELAAARALDGATAIWSLWPGYLREPAGRALAATLAADGIALHVHHASGHAFVPDLQRLVTALAPARVVPIHLRHQPLAQIDDGPRVGDDDHAIRPSSASSSPGS